MSALNPAVRIVALVPAAGVGVRAGAETYALPKQYRVLAGEPMLRRTVQALLSDPRVEQVRVVVAPDDARAQKCLAGLPRTLCRPHGGATRAQTVLNGLRDAQLQAEDWVLVHDAARPGLPTEALMRLIDACSTHAVGGLLALPVADTVKQARDLEQEQPAVVEQTLERDKLWLAQTPQMFRAGLLQTALLQAFERGLAVTDESSAIEAAGYAPLLIHGSARNAKITWPEDFGWVQSWL